MKSVKKFFGYVSAVAGLGLLAVGVVKEIKDEAIKYLPFLGKFASMYVMAAGVVLIVVSIFSLKGAIRSKIVAKRDVPVVEGGQVVAYKRE